MTFYGKIARRRRCHRLHNLLDIVSSEVREVQTREATRQRLAIPSIYSTRDRRCGRHVFIELKAISYQMHSVRP